ncbi:acyl-CoA dehydrogenase family protein [Phytoactinopolyspora mesophila]|uniref:Acyl-CoA dehydrogenase n=1 Tax=Phytoactinopolyspora mesophila TaxID=2650750 RepID=A0A7K3M8C0_9ACTN|nr:acyl-CoA dehydrogenase family protein [Phytoactinopolyspora mesophila]NDL58658.1 acyl-CoA dehydrogenase [Phytoactinopolyspora mesophila]
MTTTQPAAVHVDEQEARRVAEAARETEWRKPSFAKELYLGRFRLDLIHPHPTLSAEDTARAARFLEQMYTVCTTELDAAVIEREGRIPDESIKALARIGAFGMKIPEEYGGLGLTQVAYNEALRLATSAHPSLGALLSAHQSIGVPEPVKAFGTEEQKQEYLPRCARGAISAFLLTEPDVGSDPARLATTATPIEDGNAYELDGVKLWTTNGVVAELLVVMARAPEREGERGGITAFIVEADSPGITVENRNAFMGLRGIENGVTRFDRVRVPAQNRLGPEGGGLKIALTTLNTGRLAIPATCSAATKWCAKIAREWSAARVQWGKPVGRHAAVAHKISYITATAFAQEAILELSAHMADENRHDIRIEAALAKLWCSETAWKVADELVQIRGGRGYETADSLQARGERAVPAEQVLRDLRINRIFEGSTEIMHLLIAREAVDAHLQAAGDIIDPDVALAGKAKAAASATGFYAKWLPKLATGTGQLPNAYSEFGTLATHLRYIERASRKLARQTFYGMARWQGKLEKKQGFLARVVDIGAELFAMAAVCVRANIMRSNPEGLALSVAATGSDGPGNGGASPAETAEELADVFCRQARLRTEGLFRALWHNTDSADESLAKAVLQGQYTWFEAGVLDVSEGTGPWIADPDPIPKENVARRMLPSTRSPG